MTTTDKVMLPTAIAKARNIVTGGGPAAGPSVPAITFISRGITTKIQANINRNQALISARALNTCGISPSFWFYSCGTIIPLVVKPFYSVIGYAAPQDFDKSDSDGKVCEQK